jgi:redox-sensitive bicupin YhaK (pirin superfamily)
MIYVRRKDEIYHKEGGWFAANWHFSFDEYYDPANMGFGTLRVFNDDRLQPGVAWPLHPHRDIEGITYVVEGTFEHKDSMGNGGVFPAGSVQRATLGSGMWHSEMNHSKTEPLRFIQMWIIPRERNLPPSVEQKELGVQDRTNVLLPAVSPDGAAGVSLHQDAWVYLSRLEAGRSLEHEMRPGFGAYLFLIEGELAVNDERLTAGDAARIVEEDRLTLEAAAETAELIMVEVRL